MFFSGDLHNLLDKFMQKITEMDITNDNIFNVGDANIGLYEGYMDKWVRLNTFLQKRNIKLYVVRGNHDDPRFYMGKYMDIFSNIFLVPDYTVITIGDKNILCIGGAISVDRVKRKQIELNNENLAGKLVTYFENEALRFTQSEMAKIANMRDIYAVVSHTAPQWCSPILNIKKEEDPMLAKELAEERNNMGVIMDILLLNNNIRYHFYGHFHNFYHTEYKGIDHYCLDELEFRHIYD